MLCADWRAEYGYTDVSNSAGPSVPAVPKLKLKVPPKTEPAAPNAQATASAPTPPVTHHLQPARSTPSDVPSHTTRSQAPAASTPLPSAVVQPAPSYSRPTPPILPPHLRTSTPSHLSRSPSVPAPHVPAIKAVDLFTHPAGRRIPIQQNGIARLSAWSVRLGVNETSITLTVQLASDSALSPAPTQPNGITNGNTIPDLDAVEIKHNTVAVVAKPGTEKKARWDVPLSVGPNALEVRVRGSGHPGNVWRISVERMM